MLFVLTIPAAFLYLSGAIAIARHDALYAALLIAVWFFYFFFDKLLRTRVGPLLMLAGQFLPPALALGFFGGIYWLILSHP